MTREISTDPRIQELVEEGVEKKVNAIIANDIVAERVKPGGEIPTALRKKGEKQRKEQNLNKAKEEERKQKQRELIKASNTVDSIFGELESDKMHKLMFSRYRKGRNNFFDAEFRHGKRSRPGWGYFGWETRKQVGENMKRMIDGSGGAQLPYTQEKFWEEIFSDPERWQ